MNKVENQNLKRNSTKMMRMDDENDFGRRYTNTEVVRVADDGDESFEVSNLSNVNQQNQFR